MEARPMCACGSPVRQKGKRQDGTPVWRSKCSRCETRVVDTMVSTDLVEEMQRTQSLRSELQALQVTIEKLKQSGEEQKEHILKVEAEKVDLGSTLERERQDRADAEGHLNARIERTSAQVQLLRDERNYSMGEIKALELKTSTMRELMGEADEMNKARGLQIQDLQAKLSDRDELQVEIEEQKKHILKIEVEKFDLGSALEKERRDRADAEGNLKVNIAQKRAQVQMLDEVIKARGVEIQGLQAKLTDQDEHVEDLQQTVRNMTRESNARLEMLTEARNAWSRISAQMDREREESRHKEAWAANVIESERRQTSTLRAEQRKLTLALKGVGAGFVLVVLLTLGAALWATL